MGENESVYSPPVMTISMPSLTPISPAQPSLTPITPAQPIVVRPVVELPSHQQPLPPDQLPARTSRATDQPPTSSSADVILLQPESRKRKSLEADDSASPGTVGATHVHARENLPVCISTIYQYVSPCCVQQHLYSECA